MGRGVERTDRACEPTARHVSSRSVPMALWPRGSGGSAIRTKSLDVLPPCEGVALSADMVSAKRSGARGWDASRRGAGIVDCRIAGGFRQGVRGSEGLSAALELKTNSRRCRRAIRLRRVSGSDSGGLEAMRSDVGRCGRWWFGLERARSCGWAGSKAKIWRGPRQEGRRCVRSGGAADVGMRGGYSSMASKEAIGGAESQGSLVAKRVCGCG